MAVVLRLMLMRRNHLRRKQHAEHELATTSGSTEVSEKRLSSCNVHVSMVLENECEYEYGMLANTAVPSPPLACQSS